MIGTLLTIGMWVVTIVGALFMLIIIGGTVYEIIKTFLPPKKPKNACEQILRYLYNRQALCEVYASADKTKTPWTARFSELSGAICATARIMHEDLGYTHKQLDAIREEELCPKNAAVAPEV
jgi:hypothetical protein